MLWNPRVSADWAISIAREYISRDVRADGDCIRRKVPKFMGGYCAGPRPGSSRAQGQELSRVVPQKPLPRGRGQGDAVEGRDRIGHPHLERVVAAEHDSLGPEGLE